MASAPDPVQAQTRLLMRAIAARRLPCLLFLNKLDQPGTDRAAALRTIRARLTARAVLSSEASGPEADESDGPRGVAAYVRLQLRLRTVVVRREPDGRVVAGVERLTSVVVIDPPGYAGDSGVAQAGEVALSRGSRDLRIVDELRAAGAGGSGGVSGGAGCGGAGGVADRALGFDGWSPTALSNWRWWVRCRSLTKVGFFSPVSTSADFRLLAPLVLMAGLVRAGVRVLEPCERCVLAVPSDTVGAGLTRLAPTEARVTDTEPVGSDGTEPRLIGTAPTSAVAGLRLYLPGLTRREEVLARPGRGRRDRFGAFRPSATAPTAIPATGAPT